MEIAGNRLRGMHFLPSFLTVYALFTVTRLHGVVIKQRPYPMIKIIDDRVNDYMQKLIYNRYFVCAIEMRLKIIPLVLMKLQNYYLDLH